jgi:hypothetical protein
VVSGVGPAIVMAFAIVMTVTHPDGFGPHGFLDWVPIGMANAGGGLWLRSLLLPRRRATDSPAATSVRP